MCFNLMVNVICPKLRQTITGNTPIDLGRDTNSACKGCNWMKTDGIMCDADANSKIGGPLD